MVAERTYALLFASSLLVNGVGCALGNNDPMIDPPPSAPATPEAQPTTSLRESLRAPADLAVMADAETSFVTLTAGHVPSGASKAVEMAVLGGDLDVHTTVAGLLVIDTLAVELSDLEVPAAFVPPEGIALTGVIAHLDGPKAVEAEWSADGSTATAELSLDVVVDWAIRSEDGEVIQLSPLVITGMTMDVSLARGSDGHIAAHLSGLSSGAFWSWAGILELSDLSVEVSAQR
ncbi:MAG TPA: hypothetical protein VFG83_01030 [Kofleriaceae bacterium]|nr:hypothetical protein [Kofleriaceae bacterium]